MGDRHAAQYRQPRHACQPHARQAAHSHPRADAPPLAAVGRATPECTSCIAIYCNLLTSINSTSNIHTSASGRALSRSCALPSPCRPATWPMTATGCGGSCAGRCPVRFRSRSEEHPVRQRANQARGAQRRTGMNRRLGWRWSPSACWWAWDWHTAGSSLQPRRAADLRPHPPGCPVRHQPAPGHGWDEADARRG